MTNPLYISETLPADDLAAMREFDDRYIASIGAIPPDSWADFGDLIPTAAPMTTFPITALALKYLQTEGEDRFKTLLHKSFTLKSQEFDCGIQAPLLSLLQHVFAYRNWQQGPARMMIAEAKLRTTSIAGLIEDGLNQDWVDGKKFFSTTHLANLVDSSQGTWSNYQSSGASVLDIAKIQEEVTAMMDVRDENGAKLDVYPDTILVPTEKYEALKNLLAKDLILDPGGAAATTNPFKGRFNVVHVKEFTDSNDWYLVDSKLRGSSGLAPWISVRYTVPGPSLELRHFDESSDFFKNTGNIKVSSHVWYGFALAFPHCIRKVVGA